MIGAIPPFPNTPSWRHAQLKSTGTTLPLPAHGCQTSGLSKIHSNAQSDEYHWELSLDPKCDSEGLRI
jgi:hypothetical protein